MLVLQLNHVSKRGQRLWYDLLGKYRSEHDGLVIYLHAKQNLIIQSDIQAKGQIFRKDFLLMSLVKRQKENNLVTFIDQQNWTIKILR